MINYSQIIADASNLYERIHPTFIDFEKPTKEDNFLIEKRLAHWQDSIAKGNIQKFQQRLQLDGLTVEDAKRIIGPVKLKKGAPLPPWATTLKSIIDSVENFSEKKFLPSPLNAERKIPFEDMLLPLLSVARQQLFARLNIKTFNIPHIHEQAYLDLEYDLVRHLSKLSQSVLELEFSKVRPAGISLLSMMIEEGAEPNPSNDYYLKFVHQLLQPKQWLDFFKRYPVLARLFATAIDFWVNTTAEFIERLLADWQKIQRIFFPQSSLHAIQHIETSLSDAHREGHSVMIVHFNDAHKLVYKPKNLALSVSYYRFLMLCNQKNIPLPFKMLQILPKETYGWEEYIDYQTCHHASEATHFYQRAGMLLCVMYLLGASDCHYENLMAHREHLILLDTETLLAPLVSNYAESFLWNSVLRTGMLPRWQVYPQENVAYDVSGLGCPSDEQGIIYMRRWKAINTDAMYQIDEPVKNLGGSPNIPSLQNQLLSPRDYLDDIVSGFSQAYHFFLQHRDELMHHPDVIQFKNSWVRFICRNTETYFYLLNKSYSAEYLTNGIDRSIALDQLSLAYLENPERLPFWQTAVAEIKALEQMDIPYFATVSSSTTLSLDNTLSLSNFFEFSSYDLLQQQFDRLDEIDLKKQISLIEGAFYAQAADPHPVIKNSTNQKITSTEINNDDFISAANRIAQEIKQHIIWDKDKSARWIAPHYDLQSRHFVLQPLGNNLYDGNLGIALFLMAFAQHTQTSEWYDLAWCALKPLTKILNGNADSQKRLLNSMTIGGFTGVGSVIYALTQLYAISQNTDILNDVKQMADLFLMEHIQSDKQLDILDGAAGTILGLLKLYQHHPDPSLLKKAIACGEHLLQHRVQHHDWYVWQGVVSYPLTGFSHGAAGISYALMQLFQATNNPAYLQAAQQGFHFEKNYFSETELNWQDLRFQDSPHEKKFMMSWCHGAPGIVLGRLGCIANHQDANIQQDIELGLTTTQHHLGDNRLDQLCCGNFGCIETLILASQTLKNSHWLTEARSAAAALLKNKNHFQLFAKSNASLFNPGFFQGTSGIGYQLLRLINPEKFPSILILE